MSLLSQEILTSDSPILIWNGWFKKKKSKSHNKLFLCEIRTYLERKKFAVADLRSWLFLTLSVFYFEMNLYVLQSDVKEGKIGYEYMNVTVKLLLLGTFESYILKYKDHKNMKCIFVSLCCLDLVSKD